MVLMVLSLPSFLSCCFFVRSPPRRPRLVFFFLAELPLEERSEKSWLIEVLIVSDMDGMFSIPPFGFGLAPCAIYFSRSRDKGLKLICVGMLYLSDTEDTVGWDKMTTSMIAGGGEGNAVAILVILLTAAVSTGTGA